MCEAAVFMDKDGAEEQVMENVVELKTEGDRILLVDVFGEQKLLSARIKEVELLDHKIFLRESDT